MKQVIVIRKKYPSPNGGETKSVRSGKMAAQASHASMKIFFDRIVSQHIDGDSLVLSMRVPANMVEWINGQFAKIVVGVETEEDLLSVYNSALGAGLPSCIIQDAGRTEFGGVSTMTAVAIGPADDTEIDKITGHLSLM